MNIKKIISTVLGIFVLSSIAFYTVSETKKSENLKKQSSTATEMKIIPEKEKVVNGLYFHGTNRCHTCNLMEGYIRDVLSISFEKEIKEGRLTFESIDIDQPASAHYIQDYQLNAISFFLSFKKNGKEMQVQQCDKIWQLAKDEMMFKKYIKDEISKFLEM